MYVFVEHRPEILFFTFASIISIAVMLGLEIELVNFIRLHIYQYCRPLNEFLINTYWPNVMFRVYILV